jgi:hypothetical protein
MFAVLAVIIIVIARYASKVNKLKIERFEALALKMNLKYERRKPSAISANLNYLTGFVRQYPIEIYEKIIKSGKNSHMYTCISIKNTALNYNFTIGKEHFFSKIGKTFGFNDIEFDNPEFDKIFRLKSDDEARFRMLMNYELQNDLMELNTHLRANIVNSPGQLEYTIFGGLDNEARVEELEKVVAYMVKILNR